MSHQASTAPAKAPLPNIPKMDAAPAAARTGGTLGAEIRQVVSDVKQQVKAEVDAAKAQSDAAKAQSNLAKAQSQAKIAQAPQGGIPSTAPPPAFPNSPDDVPPNAMNVAYMFFVFTGILVLGFPIVRVLARRFDRKTQAMHVSGPDLTPALRQLQESVDAMAIEVERISEGQRFTSKLLAERGLAAGPTDRKAAG
jgi:hypothetical protein